MWYYHLARVYQSQGYGTLRRPDDDRWCPATFLGFQTWAYAELILQSVRRYGWRGVTWRAPSVGTGINWTRTELVGLSACPVVVSSDQQILKPPQSLRNASNSRTLSVENGERAWKLRTLPVPSQ